MGTHQKSVGRCCLCIHLRHGVAMIACATIVHAVLCMAHLFMSNDTFVFGGYNPHTLHLQVVIGTAGIFFAPAGLMGIYDDKPTWVRSFANFIMVKLFVLILVFGSDIVSLRHCRGWASSVQAMLAPNPMLYAVSSKGLCDMARFWYLLGFGVDFLVTAYFAFVTRDLAQKIEAIPAYRISFKEATHLQHRDHPKFHAYDPDIGEPIQYLGPATFRISELFRR